MGRSHLAWIGLAGLFVCILLLASSCGLPVKSTHEHLRSQGRPGFSSRIGSLKTGDALIIRPIASSGCGKPAPFTPGLSENEVLTSGGHLRLYRLHLPSGYRDNVPQALVLNFHGHGGTAAGQERLTQLSRLADQQDFIAVYPQGMIGPDHRSGWSTGPVWDPHVNDVLFVSDLLNHLQAELCIDPSRIYAMGFSNGGGMTNLLAARMAGRIAAFASVSGSYYPVAGGYHPLRPVSLLEIHGTADQVVPYNGDRAKDYASVTRWLLGWVQRDHCNNRPDIFLKQRTMLGEEWEGCRAGAVIIHYRIMHEQHVWPTVLFREQTQQGARLVSATVMIWRFFQNHPLRVRPLAVPLPSPTSKPALSQPRD